MDHLRPLATTLLALTLVSGCVVFDEKNDTGYDPDTTDPDRPDPTDPLPDPEPGLTLNPDEAMAGEVVFASLLATGLDLEDALAIHILGESDVDVIATQSRSFDETLLVIDVPLNAEEGGYHLFVEWEDDEWFVEDAFFVMHDIEHSDEDRPDFP